MEKLAVVILNYNGSHYLQKFLPTVLAHSAQYSVYVADNSSTDDSISLLKDQFPSVKLIEFDKNYGFSEGYNRALEKIPAEYYMLLNSDVEVTTGWLDPMVELLDENPGIAVCQPKLLQYHNRSFFEYAGAAGGFIDQYGYPFCRGRIFRKMERDYGQYDDTRSVFWATGACMLIRSDLFRGSGGFDPDFFAHMEEIDLCWRLQLSGYAVYFCGDSQVYHVGGGTLHQSNPFKTYLNFRNSLITLIKNSNKNGLYRRLIIRGLFDLIAGIKFLFFESAGNFRAVLRANVHVYKKFKYHLNKRKTICRKRENLPNILPYSIVSSYYISGRKFFFNLDSIIPDPVVTTSEPFPEIQRKSKGQIYDYRGSEGEERSINEKNSDA
jgi:GT2 family glycosyltransferase